MDRVRITHECDGLSRADERSDRLYHFSPGTVLYLLREDHPNFYKVAFGGQTMFVLRSCAVRTAEEASSAPRRALGEVGEPERTGRTFEAAEYSSPVQPPSPVGRSSPFGMEEVPRRVEETIPPQREAAVREPAAVPTSPTLGGAQPQAPGGAHSDPLQDEIARWTARGWILVERAASEAQMRKPKRFSFVWAFLWLLVFGVGILVYLFWHWAKSDQLVFLRVVDGHVLVSGTCGFWGTLFAPFAAYWRWAGHRPSTQGKLLAYGGPVAAVILLIIIISVASATGGNGDGDAEQVAAQPTDDGALTSVEGVGGYSVLEFTEVSVVDGDKVLISGTTGLPDGATLIVGFDVAGRSDSDVYIGVDQKTTVTNGEFSVTLSVPQRDEFITGPYEISVLFTPRGQSDDVIRLVGEDGENLTGSLVDDALGFRTMRLVETRDLNLTVGPPSYTFQQPSEFLEGSAERALAEYVFGWKNQDWLQIGQVVDLPPKTGPIIIAVPPGLAA